VFARLLHALRAREGEAANVLGFVVPRVQIPDFSGDEEEVRFDAIDLRLRFLAVAQVFAVMKDEFLAIDTSLRRGEDELGINGRRESAGAENDDGFQRGEIDRELAVERE
jgi:hypothetical protein